MRKPVGLDWYGYFYVFVISCLPTTSWDRRDPENWLSYAVVETAMGDHGMGGAAG
ncbi:MAG TPA: hypothetical protein VK709_19060 [Candidatus Saccharimonadales bacterium]|nr:hypothetical protein [Candidatus Saccharimonadales bacterium]